MFCFKKIPCLHRFTFGTDSRHSDLGYGAASEKIRRGSTGSRLKPVIQQGSGKSPIWIHLLGQARYRFRISNVQIWRSLELVKCIQEFITPLLTNTLFKPTHTTYIYMYHKSSYITGVYTSKRNKANRTELPLPVLRFEVS